MSAYQWRQADAQDVATVVALHVESWRATYTPILSAEYLACDIEGERATLWSERLAQPDPLRTVWLLERDRVLCGFACVELDADAQWGVLLDNLHVAPGAHGLGLGKALMAQAAVWSLAQRPHCGMFLWVFAANPKARAFYEHLQGCCVEETAKDLPDGGSALTHRMAWTPTALTWLAAQRLAVAG